MSQTETLLLVVLGFALATLIALFLGRLMWSAALKIGAKRMQKQVPSSLVGLQTERDRLRAEYAMLSQRLNSRLEETKLRMAEQMAEVSRHRNRLDELETVLAERDAAIADLKDEVASLTTELAASSTLQAELQQTIAEKQEALAELQQLLAEREREMDLAPFAAQSQLFPADPEDRLRQRIGKLNKLALTVAKDRRHEDIQDVPDIALPAASLPPTDPLVIEKLGEAERETGDLQKELEELDAEWSKRLHEMADAEPADEHSDGDPRVANVISLANRIRDPKKGMGTS
jgi:chromosome segregation ATPase